ncbi:TPA: hypothetical protein ENS27_10210 [bacterium]|nr:hypothetical protein [bacterium]
MKKIFSILISFLFLVSVVGIASVASTCYLPDVTTVHVGETFTVKYPCNICDQGYLELVGKTGEFNEYYTYKALKPGKVSFCSNCENKNYCATVTILPKEYPIFSFMKMLGFGKKK